MFDLASLAGLVVDHNLMHRIADAGLQAHEVHAVGDVAQVEAAAQGGAGRADFGIHLLADGVGCAPVRRSLPAWLRDPTGPRPIFHIERPPRIVPA